MKKSFIIKSAIAALVAGIATPAFATNGYQLDGIGQYAMGMAGAVVAAPDDPLSAALSNPAGLALMTPQAAFSAEIFNPTRRANFGDGEVGSHSNIYGIPAIGWVAPAFAKNWVFGGGVYGTSGMGVNYLQPNVMGPAYNVRATPPTPGMAPGAITGFTSLTMMQMSPSVAWKVNNRLAVGASLNISAEQGSFAQYFTPNNNAFFAGQSNSYYAGGGLNLSNPSWSYGVGVTLGALYKVNSMITLGAAYKSEMIFTPMTWQEPTEVGPGGITGGPGQYSGHLNYPQQIALGIAIRPIPRWLISVEGQWINWRNTMNTFNISGPWTGASNVSLPMHWSNEWVANIGTQYNVNNWLQVRAGYVYGNNPISNTDAASNLIFPAIVEHAVTVGATQKLGMGWKLTEAYMHSFSNTVTGPVGSSPFFGPQAPSSTMSENSYGLQVGYEF